MKRSHKCQYIIPQGPKWSEGVSTFVARKSKNLPVCSDLEYVVASSSSSRSNSPALPNHYLSSVPLEDRQLFGIEDAFLLTHFISTTSSGILGDQKLWAGDVLQLAFQV